MKWLWSFLFLVAMASGAVANEILVSVGAKQNATRVVLTFETLPKWSSNQSDRTLALSFDTDAVQIDETERVGAADDVRINGISIGPDGKELSIVLACDCATDVYPFGASSLVIEIRDTLLNSPVEQVAAVAPSQPPRPDPVENAPSIAIPPEPEVVLSSPGTPETPEVPERDDGNDVWRFPAPPLDAGLDLLDTIEFSIRSDAESRAVELLSRELARAASQGLVAAGPEPKQNNRAKNDRNSSSNMEDRSNIKIVTSLDRAIASTIGAPAPTDAGSVCFPDSAVDIAAWGDTTDISTIGTLRHKAYGENGDIVHDGARDLARYYIALGFGSEAAAAASFMDEGPQKNLLLSLADIADHGASASSVMDGQIHCNGQIALWAALSRPIGTEVQPDSLDMILSTFSALAPHHRAHLGPVLAERLREVGLEDAARNAVNAVARGGLQSNESELVTARLELGGTRPDKARDTLIDISNGTDVTAAEALLELLEDAERRGMAPNPAWVEDAPSLARATEGTEVAPDLNLAGLRGRIALGQFDELRLAITDDTPGLDVQSRNRLSNSAIVEAARHADDAVFLRTELGLAKLASVADIPNGERFEVARRLQAIGLSSRALNYLVGDPESPEDLDTQIEILAATGQEPRAISILDGHDDEAAARQLGAVLSRIGENAAAVSAFDEGGLKEAAARSAIRAGNWDWIADREISGTSGNLSAAARRLAASTRPSEDTAGESDAPANGILVTSSQELRQHAEALLEETELASGEPAFTN